MTAKLRADYSGMVYVPTGSSDLILILKFAARMTSKRLVIELSHFVF